MLETLVISVFVCGSLSLLIILFTKFFLKTESYDDMIAKRKEQENELLGGKSTKKEKNKKEKTKVKKQRLSEDVGKPKAEVKPMVIEEEPVSLIEDEIEDEVNVSTGTPRESTVSKRSKKKRRKNVSFSDEGEPASNGLEHEFEAIKPTTVAKDESVPILDQVNNRRKDETETKRNEDSVVPESSTNKKKKKKARLIKGVEDEIQAIQHQPVQTPLQSQVQQSSNQPQQQLRQTVATNVNSEQQAPLPQKGTDNAVDKTSPVGDQISSKKKKKTEKKVESTPQNSAKPSTTRDPNTVGEEAQNLIRVVQLTPLNRTELKNMCNILVEKGGPALTDPDEELQTQMQILRASESAMRDDLMKERANSTNLNKNATERIQALNMKIAELQADLGRTNQTLQEYRQFRDENERLKTNLKNQKDLENRFKIVTDQFAINASQLDSTERAKKALETMVERMQAQIKNYEQVNGVKLPLLTTTPKLVGRKGRKHASMESSLTEQLGAAQNARAATDVELREARSELEKVQKANASLCYDNKNLQERSMKLERDLMKIQQKVNAESRGAAEGQEDPSHQQQRNANSGIRQEQLEKLPSTNGETVKEKETMITDLESQVQRLNQQIDSQRQKNNVLRERNWKLVEEMKKVQTASSAHVDPESERMVALLRQEVETSARIRGQLESRLSASSERLHSMQAEADKVARLSQSLRAKEKEVAELQQAKETLESRLKSLQSESVDRVQLSKELNSRTTEITNLRKENEAITEVTEQLKEAIRRIEPLEREALQLQRDLATKQQTINGLLSERRELRAQQARQNAASVDDSMVLTCLQGQVDELRRENELLKTSAGSGDSEKLQQEIDTLRTKNNELREKNWKTVEALNAAQTEAERRVKATKEESRTEKQHLQQKISHLESQVTANEGCKEMLQKAEREKAEVEEQVNRYKAALSETETILRDLEQSVESEEKKWQAALHESEQEGERMRRELASVYSELKKTGASHEEITDLDFAYRCVEKSLGDIVDEMEEKLATAEEDLAEITRQRDELAERLEAQPVQQQSEEKQVEDLDRVSDLSAEIEDLRAQLVSEQKSKKELAQQTTKFSALVRIGQDALKEEQDLVKKLQLQLQSYEKNHRQNGGKVQNAS